MIFLGIDPGPKPGVYELEVLDSCVQVAGAVRDMAPRGAIERLAAVGPLTVVCESFHISKRTVQSTRGGTNTTVDQIGAIKELCNSLGVALHLQSAGQVKPWASDTRLAAWGLTAPNRHHRDAARHALYCAVTQGYLPVRAPQEGGEYDD